ncbi:uncharacterized protein LOC129841423 isoform X2 [Salvelinus fontinalis]|uniref:uncharacterized protein LOC129841423 isoform X2 n=1 Tax=Salvelinus fontinalis TaxID=8038 RepID=UPI002485A324|nr:uncharacterized protein LOC129841423 isoform X2 [Salvelinus fontinalis]
MAMVFHTQIASIMEVLANAAVAEICKLVDDDYAVFRLEITQSQKENRALRRKLQLLELKKVARERAERTTRERVIASRFSSVKILDRYRGIARGQVRFVKPAGHNTWRDDLPITVDEGSRTSTQQVIVIESADVESADPGVKLERSEGEPIQTGVAGVPPVATEDPTTAPAAPRTRRSITKSAVLEDLLISSVTGGGDWTSEVAGHKPRLRLRTLDQEPSRFLPELEPGPNREGQRLHHNHYTEHDRWTEQPQSWWSSE